jgi:hypothetical protein
LEAAKLYGHTPGEATEAPAEASAATEEPVFGGDSHGGYAEVYNQSTPEIYDRWSTDGYDETVDTVRASGLVSRPPPVEQSS